MIKPEQLRIGNLVTNKQRGLCRIYGINKEIVQVDVVEFPHDGSIMLNHDEIESIPTTAENISLYFDIEIQNEDKLGLWIELLFDNIGWVYFNLLYTYLELDGNKIFCNGLHNIQNAHYFLSGQEIKVK